MPTEQAQRIAEEVKQLSLEDLRSISEQILEEIEDREWDRVLTSPEGEADNEREYQKTLQAIKEGRFVEHIPGVSLEELFHR
jgi:hypothetical protein